MSQLPQPPYERGTATILRMARMICNFARRYDYIRLLDAATGDTKMGLAIQALIIACDAFRALDTSPGETAPGEVQGGSN